MIPLRVLGQVSATPTATYVLLALNVLFWFLLQRFGNDPDFTASLCRYALWPGRLWEFGAFDVPSTCIRLHAIPDARPVTFVSSMFLHGGWLHLIGNMWYFLVLAPHLEDRIGSPVAFLAFYMLCGLGAAATQVAIDPNSMVPMLGASGAIAGVLGAYAVLFPRIRIWMLIPVSFIPVPLRLTALILVLVWFLLQLLGGLFELMGRGGEVAYGAHVGGFLTGVITSLLYVLYENHVYGRSADASTHAREEE